MWKGLMDYRVDLERSVVGEGRDDAADGEDGEWRDDGPN
jgi:hypothetical protein